MDGVDAEQRERRRRYTGAVNLASPAMSTIPGRGDARSTVGLLAVAQGPYPVRRPEPKFRFADPRNLLCSTSCRQAMTSSTAKNVQSLRAINYALSGVIALAALVVLVAGYPEGGSVSQWERSPYALLPLLGAALVAGGQYTDDGRIKWFGAVSLFAFAGGFLFHIGKLFLFPVGLLLLAMALEVHLKDKLSTETVQEEAQGAEPARGDL